MNYPHSAPRRLLVTGGAGFIGSNFVLHWLENNLGTVVNLDNLTYAGNLLNLAAVREDDRHRFTRGDINDADLLDQLFREQRPDAVVHFAAESHVDRSIHAPADFINTNVNGTFRLLHAALAYWQELEGEERSRFRFLQVSTDEVYGSLGPDDPRFNEETAYRPNSPYSASKAAADHLARAYHHTYGLPVLTTNCSNNYGPFQFPEKLIPLMILHAIAGKPLPVYGDGKNVRDWLFVRDHCRGIEQVLAGGRPGETYCIGGNNEIANIDVVNTITSILDELRPRTDGKPYASQITYVKDRPGHDRRYAIDTQKMVGEFGWTPEESFASGLRKTVEWYLDNQEWVKHVTSGDYRQWISLNYDQRSQVCGA